MVTLRIIKKYFKNYKKIQKRYLKAILVDYSYNYQELLQKSGSTKMEIN